MKKKFAKILSVIALAIIAPIGVMMTGCANDTKQEASLTLKSTNRTTLYKGETIDNVGWQADYFDGQKTVTIDLSSINTTGFNTSAVGEDLTATITYKGLTKTLDYNVEATPFNISKIYRSLYGEPTQMTETITKNVYSYIKFSSNGQSFIITGSTDLDITEDAENWQSSKEWTFTELKFNSDNQWTAFTTMLVRSELVKTTLTKISNTCIQLCTEQTKDECTTTITMNLYSTTN